MWRLNLHTATRAHAWGRESEIKVLVPARPARLSDGASTFVCTGVHRRHMCYMCTLHAYMDTYIAHFHVCSVHACIICMCVYVPRACMCMCVRVWCTEGASLRDGGPCQLRKPRFRQAERGSALGAGWAARPSSASSFVFLCCTLLSS